VEAPHSHSPPRSSVAALPGTTEEWSGPALGMGAGPAAETGVWTHTLADSGWLSLCGSCKRRKERLQCWRQHWGAEASAPQWEDSSMGSDLGKKTQARCYVFIKDNKGFF
jgi:hypothetical protein